MEVGGERGGGGWREGWVWRWVGRGGDVEVGGERGGCGGGWGEGWRWMWVGRERVGRGGKQVGQRRKAQEGVASR